MQQHPGTNTNSSPRTVSYTQKAPQAWHRQGRQKQHNTPNSYNYTKLPSTGTTYRSMADAPILQPEAAVNTVEDASGCVMHMSTTTGYPRFQCSHQHYLQRYT